MMGDPRRWRDDPQARPAAADILLRGARRPQAPQPEELARLGAAIEAFDHRPAFAPRGRPWFVTAVAAAATLAALGTGAWAWRASVERRASAPARVLEGAVAVAPAQPRVALRPSTVSEEGPVAEAAPAPRRRHPVRAHRRERPAPPARPSAPTPVAVNADALARETALVDSARRDLVAAPSSALALLGLHRREFPRGQLAAEREFLAVEALRRLGRLPEARRRAAELKADYPTSSYAARAARLLDAP